MVAYQQTVQAAFRDAHDALFANERVARGARRAVPSARPAARALELADLRYRAGYSPYLEVLDLQRQLLQAQTLADRTAARDARLALVDLAKALGGGWDYKDAVAARR